MSVARIPLSKCKLWWPAWQQGIPFTHYGYFREVSGEGYKFIVDPEMDSWLCENGDLMPISTSTLEVTGKGPIKWTSFSVLPNGQVQVNFRDNKKDCYYVTYYAVGELSLVGETYSLDE